MKPTMWLTLLSPIVFSTLIVACNTPSQPTLPAAPNVAQAATDFNDFLDVFSGEDEFEIVGEAVQHGVPKVYHEDAGVAVLAHAMTANLWVIKSEVDAVIENSANCVPLDSIGEVIPGLNLKVDYCLADDLLGTFMKYKVGIYFRPDYNYVHGNVSFFETLLDEQLGFNYEKFGGHVDEKLDEIFPPFKTSTSWFSELGEGIYFLDVPDGSITLTGVVAVGDSKNGEGENEAKTLPPYNLDWASSANPGPEHRSSGVSTVDLRCGYSFYLDSQRPKIPIGTLVCVPTSPELAEDAGFMGMVVRLLASVQSESGQDLSQISLTPHPGKQLPLTHWTDEYLQRYSSRTDLIAKIVAKGMVHRDSLDPTKDFTEAKIVYDDESPEIVSDDRYFFPRHEDIKWRDSLALEQASYPDSICRTILGTLTAHEKQVCMLLQLKNFFTLAFVTTGTELMWWAVPIPFGSYVYAATGPAAIAAIAFTIAAYYAETVRAANISNYDDYKDAVAEQATAAINLLGPTAASLKHISDYRRTTYPIIFYSDYHGGRELEEYKWNYFSFEVPARAEKFQIRITPDHGQQLDYVLRSQPIDHQMRSDDANVEHEASYGIGNRIFLEVPYAGETTYYLGLTSTDGPANASIKVWEPPSFIVSEFSQSLSTEGGTVEDVMNFFHPDAVVTGGFSESIQGHAQIRSWVESLKAAHVQLTTRAINPGIFTTLLTEGENEVTLFAEINSDVIPNLVLPDRSLGVAAHVENGLIEWLTFIYSSDSVDRLNAAETFDGFVDRLNEASPDDSSSITSVLGSFAGDASVIGGIYENYPDQQALRSWIAAWVEDNVDVRFTEPATVDLKGGEIVTSDGQIKIEGVEDGFLVTRNGTLTTDPIRQDLGLAPLEVSFTALVNDGKIDALNFRYGPNVGASLVAATILKSFADGLNDASLDDSASVDTVSELFSDGATASIDPVLDRITGEATSSGRFLRTSQTADYYIRGLVEHHSSINLGNQATVDEVEDGFIVIRNGTVTMDTLMDDLGLAPLEVSLEAMVNDGKIKHLNIVYTPYALENLVAATTLKDFESSLNNATLSFVSSLEPVFYLLAEGATASGRIFSGDSTHPAKSLVVQLVEDNVVVTLSGPATGGIIKDNYLVRPDGEVTDVEVEGVQDGFLLTREGTITTDEIKAAGRDSLDLSVEAVVADGKITRLNFIFTPLSAPKVVAAAILKTFAERMNDANPDDTVSVDSVMDLIAGDATISGRIIEKYPEWTVLRDWITGLVKDNVIVTLDEESTLEEVKGGYIVTSDGEVTDVKVEGVQNGFIVTLSGTIITDTLKEDLGSYPLGIPFEATIAEEQIKNLVFSYDPYDPCSIGRLEPTTALDTFDTVPDTSIIITPLNLVSGQLFTMSGMGFPSDSPITTVVVGGQCLMLSPNPITDSVGNFAFTYRVPRLDSGSMPVSVTVNGVTALTTLTIGAPTLTLYPEISRRGSTILVFGSGFVASTNVTVDYGTTSTGAGILSVVTSSDGTFATSFEVPTLASAAPIPSTNTVTGTSSGAGAQNTAAAVHRIPAASITMDPTEVNVGKNIIISGTGFPGFSTVSTITMGGVTITPVPGPATDSEGSFTAAAVRVPQLTVGTQAVVATAGDVTAEGLVTIESSIDPVDAFSEAIAVDPRLQVWGFKDGMWRFFNASLPAGHPINTLTEVKAHQSVWIFNSSDEIVDLTIFGFTHTLFSGWNLEGL